MRDAGFAVARLPRRLVVAVMGCSACLVPISGAGSAVAGEFAGGPAGEQISVFHPLHDPRRPVLAAVRRPGRTPRLSRLAGPGEAEAQVTSNSRGDAVAAWAEGGYLLAAVRERGRRGFGPPQVLGAGPRGDFNYPALELPFIALNPRGDAVVAWRTSTDTSRDVALTAWRPAGRGFAAARTLPFDPRHIGLDAKGEALAVGVDEDNLRVVWSTSARGARWGQRRTLGHSLGEQTVTAASNSRGEAIVLWGSEDWNDPSLGEGSAERSSNGVWRRARPPRVHRLLRLADRGDANLALSDSGDAAVVYWDSGGLKAAIRRPARPWQRPQRLAPADGTSFGLSPYGKPQAAISASGDVAVAAWTNRGIVAAVGARGRGLRVRRLTRRPRSQSIHSDDYPVDVGLAIDERGAVAAWQEVSRGRIRLLTRAFGTNSAAPPSQFTSVSFHRIGPPSACTPAGSQTQADNGIVRLYTLGNDRYACMYSRGAPVAIGHDPRSAGPALNRHFVATVDVTTNAEEFDEYDIYVHDLRTDTLSGTRAGNDVAIRSLVVGVRGGVAWIECRRPCQVNRRQAVDTATSVIASDDTIDPESLRLEGEVLSWTAAGARRTTTLR